jgi:Arc/MetJ-type ribon-helix-helix transcriptional regulator
MGRRKTDTEQVNVRISSDTVERIDRVIATHRQRSRNQVCAEIIEFYLPLWEEMEREKEALLERQRVALLGARAGESNSEPIDRDVTESARVPVGDGKGAPEKLKTTSDIVHTQRTRRAGKKQ